MNYKNMGAIANHELREEIEEEGSNCKNAFSKHCGKLTMEDIFTTDAVYLNARIAAAGFKHRPDTQKFMVSAWSNSMLLVEKVLTGKFVPRYYRQRYIMERGHKRLIKPPEFENKVVQKVICNYMIRNLLEPRMIRSSYASMTGRGTKEAYERLIKDLNKAVRLGYKNAVVTDYKGYFASIPIGKLFEDIFQRYMEDERLISLCRMFSPDDHGLSLGNEMSQIPASFYPSKFDHYVKDYRGDKFYHRYMDDSINLLPDYESCEKYIEEFYRFTESLGLVASPDKVKVLKLGKDLIYCKERFYFNKKARKYYRNINPQCVRNERKKLKQCEEELLEKEYMAGQYLSVRGVIAGHPNCRKVLEELDREAFRILGVSSIREIKEMML